MYSTARFCNSGSSSSLRANNVLLSKTSEKATRTHVNSDGKRRSEPVRFEQSAHRRHEIRVQIRCVRKQRRLTHQESKTVLYLAIL
jgi:hypothetical protein